MSEKDPKKLDQLFQQGSEQYDFEYNPEAWQRMETLLDEDKRKRRFIWWWWGALLLVGLAGSVWWVNRTAAEEAASTSKEAKTEVNAQERAETKAVDAPGKKESATEPALHTDVETPEKSSPGLLESSSEENDPNLLPGIKKQNNEQESEEKVESQRTSSRPIATLYEPIAGDKEEQPARETYETNEEGVATGADVGPAGSEQSGMLKSKQLAILSPVPYNLLTYGSLLDEEHPEPVSITDQHLPPPEPHNFLLIGLPTGAEVTIVDAEHPTKVDWKAGLQLEYFYQGRYSLSLGANYVRKSYIGGEGAYKPPVGFWTRKIAPQSTTGFCGILEVPVMVGYYPRGMLRSGFFAKAGFTSFLMLKERYYFHYDQPDEDLVKKWYGHNEYRHWFGIGQFSAGYHLKLGKRTSLQLAPYFQIPLTGLGHGKVKLWSMGMSANFGFRVGKER